MTRARVSSRRAQAAAVTPTAGRLARAVEVPARLVGQRAPRGRGGGISLIVPVVNEAETIVEIVRYARRADGVREVIVIDDGSVDDTARLSREAGARVVTSTLLGKGASMEDGLREAKEDTVVYLDGDLSGLADRVIERLAEPILAGRADLVKGSFSRSGGRVTTLTARPLLQAFFPEVAWVDQPLGGLIAVKRSLLGKLRFETDYGVDVGLLIDAAMAGARVQQTPIGHITHDSQPLEVLADMARQVVRVILDRASRHARLRTGHVREVAEVERHAQAELSRVVSHLGEAPRLALFAIDGALVRGSFLRHLSRLTRRGVPYEAAERRRSPSPSARIRVAASAFKGVRREMFLRAAREIPLVPGAVETVVALRRAGYRVGVVSGGSRLVADVIRRRVFADF